jgi:RNA polymerase sigma-70 factor (ECF subfamily)
MAASASFERERGRVSQWIFGIAHNLCIDEMRRMRARPDPIYENDEYPIIAQLVDEQIDIPPAVHGKRTTPGNCRRLQLRCQ